MRLEDNQPHAKRPTMGLVGGVAAACSAWCIAAALMALGPMPGARAQSDPAIAEFVARIDHSIRSIAAAPSDEQIRAICVSFIRLALNLDAMASAASAGTWDRMTPQQRAGYRTAFERRLARDCIFQNRQYRGESLTVLGVRRGDGGDRLVATQLGRPAQPGRLVIWRLRPGPDRKLRAVDILLDGRSMVISMSDEARSILDRANGDIDALLGSMGH